MVAAIRARWLLAVHRRITDKTPAQASFGLVHDPAVGLVIVPQAMQDAVEQQDAQLGVDAELRILLLHGVLHCLGHDHETDGGVMERLEQQLRKRYIGDG